MFLRLFFKFKIRKVREPKFDNMRMRSSIVSEIKYGTSVVIFEKMLLNKTNANDSTVMIRQSRIFIFILKAIGNR